MCPLTSKSARPVRGSYCGDQLLCEPRSGALGYLTRSGRRQPSPSAVLDAPGPHRHVSAESWVSAGRSLPTPFLTTSLINTHF